MTEPFPPVIRYHRRSYRVQGIRRVSGRNYLLLRLVSRRCRQPSSESEDGRSTSAPCYEECWMAIPARRGPLDDLCALHVLPADRLNSKRLRVLKSLARNTPFVPKILDYEFQSGGVTVITDWVPGQTLNTWLKQCSDRHRWMSPHQAVRLYRGLVQALCGLHRTTGLVHGDVHADNIVIRSGSHWLVLIDYGSAWRLLESIDRDGGDGCRQVWSAPEVLNGTPANERADQFSASMLLYQMLTGELPYERLGGKAARLPVEIQSTLWKPPSLLAPLSSASVQEKVTERPSGRFPARLWRPIDDFAARALALNPQDRFENDAEWLEATMRLFRTLDEPRPKSLMERLVHRCISRLMPPDQ